MGKDLGRGSGRVGCFGKRRSIFQRFPEKSYKKWTINGKIRYKTMSEQHKHEVVPFSTNPDEIQDFLARPNLQLSPRHRASLLACAARFRSQRDSDKFDIQEKLSPEVVTTTTTTKSNDSPDSVLISNFDQVQNCDSSSTTKPKALKKKKKKKKMKVVMV